MKRVVILGAGGFGREVLSFLQLDDSVDVAGFIDPDPAITGQVLNGIPVLGGENKLTELYRENVSHAFVAVGDNEKRENLFDMICEVGLEPLNIIHPSAVIAPDVMIGKGVIIYPNVTVNTNVKIGNSVVINSNASIGHDVGIGGFVKINPGVNIGGRVKLDKSSFLGIGCSVAENIIIGEKSTVGGGAMVIQNVFPGTRVFGVPARQK